MRERVNNYPNWGFGVSQARRVCCDGVGSLVKVESEECICRELLESVSTGIFIELQ